MMLKILKNTYLAYTIDCSILFQTNSSPRRKPVPSRIVTIPEPEAPEIPSIVKVKPREYVPKDKQANKVLILKGL